MTARRLKFALAAIFPGLDGRCLLAPGSVIRLAFMPDLGEPTRQARFVMGCFGAQAVLSGTIPATARLARRENLTDRSGTGAAQGIA